jgi:ATP-binding cassette subfamily B protein
VSNPPEWREQRSTQFVLRFLADSLAERDAPRIVARLESVRDQFIKALDWRDVPGEPIRVSLVEAIEAPDAAPGPHVAPEVLVRDGEILAAYRSDSPGAGLDRALVEVLLGAAAETRAARARALVDGVLGYVIQDVDRLGSAAVATAVLELDRRGDRPPLAEVLRGPGEGPRGAYLQVITSFVSYLLVTEGAERFRRLAREFDPAAPERAVMAVYGRPAAVLEQAWLGALRRGRPPTILSIGAFLRRSATYLRPYWRQELLILLACLFTAGFAIVQPLAYQWLIDRAILPGNRRFLAALMGGLALLFVVQALASMGAEYLNARVAAAVLSDMRLRLFAHLQRLSMGFYTQAQVGDLMSRLSSDLFVIQTAMTGLLVQSVYLVLTVVASGVLLFVLEWRLALMAMAVAPLVFLGPRLFGRRAAEASYQQQQEAAQVATTLQENLGAQAVVKAFDLQDSAMATFRERVVQLARSSVRATFIGTLLGMTGGLTLTLIDLLTLGVGGFLVMRGSLSLGALVAFTGLLANVLAPMRGLSDLIQAIQQATGGMRRVDELLEEEPRVLDAPDAVPLPAFAREIRFRHVTFTYTGEQTTLDDIDLGIPAGQSVAFVGPSGCGKSTILNLTLRLYDPVSGSVTIDDLDIRRVTQHSLRSQIATVLQDTFLFNTTVRENIRLGRVGASDAEVEAAARAAEIHEVIAGLPQGYETVVGERGARFSGGQRQRLAIARAILRQAPILVLDEATSALDPQTEAAINDTLGKLSRTRTTITVTHRLASVIHADRIFVLDRGRLVEHGTHAELLGTAGLYRRLWEQQYGSTAEAPGRAPSPEAMRLQAVPFFASLDGVLLAALATQLTTERYAEGDVVFVEGTPGDALYVVARGQVEVLTTGPTGAERRLAVLRDGDYFGEMALLRDAPRSATVRARAPSTLLALDRVQFTRLLEAMPDLRSAFERVIGSRLEANRAVLGR